MHVHFCFRRIFHYYITILVLRCFNYVICIIQSTFHALLNQSSTTDFFTIPQCTQLWKRANHFQILRCFNNLICIIARFHVSALLNQSSTKIFQLLHNIRIRGETQTPFRSCRHSYEEYPYSEVFQGIKRYPPFPLASVLFCPHRALYFKHSWIRQGKS